MRLGGASIGRDVRRRGLRRECAAVPPLPNSRFRVVLPSTRFWPGRPAIGRSRRRRRHSDRSLACSLAHSLTVSSPAGGWKLAERMKHRAAIPSSLRFHETPRCHRQLARPSIRSSVICPDAAPMWTGLAARCGKISAIQSVAAPIDSANQTHIYLPCNARRL